MQQLFKKNSQPGSLNPYKKKDYLSDLSKKDYPSAAFALRSGEKNKNTSKK